MNILVSSFSQIKWKERYFAEVEKSIKRCEWLNHQQPVKHYTLPKEEIEEMCKPKSDYHKLKIKEN